MYVGILFGLSTSVLSTTMFYNWVFLFGLVRSLVGLQPCSCMLVLYSTLVTLVRPCSMYVGILFGLSMAMFNVYVGILGLY